jgi:hypothetical protein
MFDLHSGEGSLWSRSRNLSPINPKAAQIFPQAVSASLVLVFLAREAPYNLRPASDKVRDS